MKAQREQAKTDVRRLRTLFKKFRVRDRARILDLPSGIGRISINLAKAGYQVVGVDISLLYLNFAKQWAVQDQVTSGIRFYRMDMRVASQQLRRKGEKKFDVLLNYGTAIGYNGQDEDVDMLTDLHSVASEHALLVIETVNREYLVRHFKRKSVSALEGIEWHELRRLNLENSFMENNWSFYRINGRSRRLILRVPVSHRVYSLHELKQLITDAGWRYAGSYETLGKLSPVTTDSFRMTVVGER
jgi:SAM-dependent methyltransferase